MTEIISLDGARPIANNHYLHYGNSSVLHSDLFPRRTREKNSALDFALKYSIAMEISFACSIVVCFPMIVT
jgi:hypothetical protein